MKVLIRNRVLCLPSQGHTCRDPSENLPEHGITGFKGLKFGKNHCTLESGGDHSGQNIVEV